MGDRSLRRPWLAEWGPRLKGEKITAITRRGKWIIVSVARGAHLVIHLGMTGQLRVVTASTALADHTHLILDLDRRRQLRFRDVRRFGSATVLAESEGVEDFFAQAGLGPEPFNVDARYWRDRLSRTARALKAVLLDQQVIAGVGNIYADEALFEARLHPRRAGRRLSAQEAGKLKRAVALVLQRAIQRRGSSIRSYVDGAGKKGSYQREFRVYGRVGQACPRCGVAIKRIRLAGRSTHFCPHCQRP
jgi:formamidopyrimidine-DNA glycosylase